MMKTFCCILLACCSIALYASFPVAEQGKAKTVIVVPEVMSEEIRFAANELRHWLEAVTGAQIPVYHNVPAGDLYRIMLGKTFYSNDDDFKFIGDSDGCVVHRNGKELYLSAPRDGGVINAVFLLLEKNTDLIFPRPTVTGDAIFTPNPSLELRETSFRARPSWNYRVFSLVGQHYHPLTSLWARRNFSNYRGMFYQKYHILNSLNLYFSANLTYEFGGLLPSKKYFESKPQFYAWQEGKRKPYEHYGPQLCYTNKEGRETLIKELFARLEQDLTPQISKVHFGFGDTWSLCNCEDCRKPIALPDGTSLTDRDEAFRSTQYFLYLNEIVDAMVKKYPHLEAETLGYIYAAVPPKIKPHEKLTVIYCPYPKDDKVPVDDPRNKKWGVRSREWAACGARMGIYEYWGDASSFPRAVSDAASVNLKLWNSLGFHHYITTETYADIRRTPVEKDTCGGAWDVSAVEYWTLARLMWDSSLDPQALRREYFRRTYGPAAGLIEEYYAAIHQQWHKSKVISMYNDSPVAGAQRYIRQPGLENVLREKLVAAEKQAVNPVAKDLIRKHLVRYDYMMKAAAVNNPGPLSIPLVTDQDWSKAVTLPEFRVAGTRAVKPEYKTQVKVMHDRNNLYLRFICSEPDIQRLKDQKQPIPGRYPAGDKAELFLRSADGKTYYHFAVTPQGTPYDGKAYDFRWNTTWQSSAKMEKDVWSCDMIIPLDKLGYRITVDNKLRLFPMRTVVLPDKTERSSGHGKRAHSAQNTFPEYLLAE